MPAFVFTRTLRLHEQMLRLVPSDAALQLQAWADRSIVQVGQGGRAAVTARVYPTLGANSSRISVLRLH